MDEADAEATRKFNQAIREKYARTVTVDEVDADTGGPAGETNASDADFGSGVRQAVTAETDMNTLLRASAFGVAYKET